MWSHGRGFKSFQQDALTSCGLLDSHDIGTCEIWTRTEGIGTFSTMQCEGMPPNPATFVGLLNACASVMALEEDGQAHELITQCGCELDVFVGSSLIDMYAKCGSMEDASRMYNKMASHNVVTWTAMLNGYAMMGMVRKLFNILSVCVKKVWR